MEITTTKYGVLKGLSSAVYYEDGTIKECRLTTINNLETPYGILVPQYEDSSERRKHINSISFHNNGNLKSISLQNQVEIDTSIGTIPAELITFYESGSINRLFPLNGKITAYWTENDEYDLAKHIEFNISVGKFVQKIITIHFYENGATKSITFWPKDRISINSPIGTVVTRIGLSFYINGNLKSLEPYNPTPVKTEIGIINAYDTDAIGIHGDSNSLKFSVEGRIESLKTSTDKIEVLNKNGEKKIYSPKLKPSVIDDSAVDIVPLNIEFFNNRVRFNNNAEDEYSINECEFTVCFSSFKIKSLCASCTACSECNGCGA